MGFPVAHLAPRVVRATLVYMASRILQINRWLWGSPWRIVHSARFDVAPSTSHVLPTRVRSILIGASYIAHRTTTCVYDSPWRILHLTYYKHMFVRFELVHFTSRVLHTCVCKILRGASSISYRTNTSVREYIWHISQLTNICLNDGTYMMRIFIKKEAILYKLKW